MYPQKGISIMEKNRRVDDIKKLADGPGKLTQAMGITMKQYGEEQTKKTGLYISDGMKVSKTIQKSRIGISKGLDKHWNFSFNVSDYL
jgi:DNA-3-methyladenine glycosylase